MIKCEILDISGFAWAIRGMRNPKNSWDKSDSGVCGDFSTVHKDGHVGCDHKCPKWSPDNYCGYSERLQKFPYDYYMIGENDLDLMKRLYEAGTEHRKYARMICVWMDITAPLYWWKEFDTYKIGTVSNSCSTMHKLHSRDLTIDDFSTDNLLIQNVMITENLIDQLNQARRNYMETGNKMWWWQMIQMLPSSYNQKRTVMMNYETVFRIIEQRSNHKLHEWRDLVSILKRLPYVENIMCSR